MIYPDVLETAREGRRCYQVLAPDETLPTGVVGRWTFTGMDWLFEDEPVAPEGVIPIEAIAALYLAVGDEEHGQLREARRTCAFVCGLIDYESGSNDMATRFCARIGGTGKATVRDRGAYFRGYRQGGIIARGEHLPAAGAGAKGVAD